jgi:hypothetical protein
MSETIVYIFRNPRSKGYGIASLPTPSGNIDKELIVENMLIDIQLKYFSLSMLQGSKGMVNRKFICIRSRGIKKRGS